MTGNCGQDVEEESSASEGETETVGKPTGKAPDTQNVQDVTEMVTEERVMEEIPPNTWELSGQPSSAVEVTQSHGLTEGKTRV